MEDFLVKWIKWWLVRFLEFSGSFSSVSGIPLVEWIFKRFHRFIVARSLIPKPLAIATTTKQPERSLKILKNLSKIPKNLTNSKNSSFSKLVRYDTFGGSFCDGQFGESCIHVRWKVAVVGNESLEVGRAYLALLRPGVAFNNVRVDLLNALFASLGAESSKWLGVYSKNWMFV